MGASGMWVLFCALFSALAALVLIPGALVTYGITGRKSFSLLLAPAISVSLIELLAIGYALVGIESSYVSLAVGALFTGMLVISFRLIRVGRIRCFSGFDLDVKLLALALLFAFALTVDIYVLPLDGPASFAQDSDNTFHMSLIQSFVSSGCWSPLSASLYSDVGGCWTVSAPADVPSFYPAAWHALAASVVSIGGVSPEFAANVTNCVILVVVFPLSLLLLLLVIFPGKRLLQLSGIIVMYAFGSFPWGTLLSVSGPLFPNTLGFCLLPANAALCLMLFSRVGKGVGYRLRLAGLLAMTMFSMLVAHPNAAFTLAIFLAPFLVSLIWRCSFKRLRSHKFATLICIIFIAAFVAVWVGLYFFPPLYATTHFEWATTATIVDASLNCFFLNYRWDGTNIFLILLVLLGVGYSVKRRRYLWLTVSFILASGIYVVGSSCDGLVKGVVSGFWYTDPYRLGASACLLAIPLAAMGLYAALSLLRLALYKLNFSSTGSRASICFVLLFVVGGLYAGNISIPGYGQLSTPIGEYKATSRASNSYDRPNLLDEQEKGFCRKACLITGSDAVYNNSDDGSTFAYSLYGMNLVNRRSLGEARGTLNGDAALLTQKLNELDYNQEVRSVLRENKIKYILNLDYGGEPLGERCYYGGYNPDNWRGFNCLTDDNPGIKVILAEGDCRLYEVIYSEEGM